jgi:DNA-directed RNA polymerase III subunit RPC1
MLRPNRDCPVKINLETKTRSFIKDPIRSPTLCPNDGWLVIQNSELMCGVVDKSIVGDGNKESMFYVVLRDYGCIEAAHCMNRLAKICARWMANQGFSIGIEDVTPGLRLSDLRDRVIKEGYDACDQLIEQHRQGTLQCQPGCNMDQTLEAQISGKLSKIRDDLGQTCLQELNRHNSALIMSVCGSKGSKINVCQMVACVGQQIISGSRIADGFDHRTLPHFQKYSRTPAAKGFVRNSFYTGLNPTEFIFHAASGREGLVDTAVKTAETGYMQRRLMKALEDLAIQYDYSVRNSSGMVIQFDYGNDRLDPAMMEGDECPVEFRRTLLSAMHHYPRECGEKTLLPFEILPVLDSCLNEKKMDKLCSEAFLDSMKQFMEKNLIQPIIKYRQKFSLPPAKNENEIIDDQSKLCD